MTHFTNVRTASSAANDQFMTNFKCGNAGGMAALYTPDGQDLSPNSDFVTGQQAIQGFW